MTTATESTTVPVLLLTAFDPETLQLDSKRADAAATVTADFVTQLTEHAKTAPPVPLHGADGGLTAQCGNHTPIVLATTDAGRLLVVMGARRTIGCLRAGVPVLGYVAGPEGTTKAQIATQLIDRLTENEGRIGYAPGEKTAIIGTLFDLKVSAAQITRRTGFDRADVDAAQVVAKSEFAAAAAARYVLTLPQAAILAEFDDANDAEGAKALILVHREDPGKFEHVAQSMRDSRAARARRAVLAAELEAAGYQVTDRHPGHLGWWNIANLRDGDGKPLTAEGHAACPGRAVQVSADWDWLDDGAEAAFRARHGIAEGEEFDPQWDTNAEMEADGYGQVWTAGEQYCTDWEANGHTQPAYSYGRPAKPEPGTAAAEAASAERKKVLRNNAAWRSANDTRTGHLTQFLARKDFGKGPAGKALREAAALYRAQATAREETSPVQMGEGHKIAAELLGLTGKERSGYAAKDLILAALDKASPVRREVIELAMALGATEHSARIQDTWRTAETSSWRWSSTRVPRYLRFLADHTGYALAEVEQPVADLLTRIAEHEAVAAAERETAANRAETDVHLPAGQAGDDDSTGPAAAADGTAADELTGDERADEDGDYGEGAGDMRGNLAEYEDAGEDGAE